jgi:hypothetical protein
MTNGDLRAAEVCDAIVRPSDTGRLEDVIYSSSAA